MEKFNDYLPQTISGKNVLVTGGTTGIGRATALLLSSLGANVIVAGLQREHLLEALHDIKPVAAGTVHGVLADLATEGGIGKLFADTAASFGKLDILINNAALPYGTTGEGDYQEWQRVVSTNLLAYMACCAEAIKLMPGGGHIVNIGSMSADVREETGSVYVATKSGVQGFSESLRKSANKQGIKVTLIEPGAVDTDMQPESGPEKLKKVKAMEMLAADDIAMSVLYCLSQPKRCDIVELKIRPHLQLI